MLSKKEMIAGILIGEEDMPTTVAFNLADKILEALDDGTVSCNPMAMPCEIQPFWFKDKNGRWRHIQFDDNKIYLDGELTPQTKEPKKNLKDFVSSLTEDEVHELYDYVAEAIGKFEKNDVKDHLEPSLIVNSLCDTCQYKCKSACLVAQCDKYKPVCGCGKVKKIEKLLYIDHTSLTGKINEIIDRLNG